MSMRPTRFELAGLLVIALILVYQLFIPPLIGMADNGDFLRVLGRNGLSHNATEHKDKFFDFFNSKYRIIEPREDWGAPYKTSTALLMQPARWLSIKSGHTQIFDIRILAALYTLLLLFGSWLILTSARSLKIGLRLVISGLLIIILTDAGYVAYFNSFYSEATVLGFLVIGIGCSLILIARRSPHVLWLAGYFLAVTLAVTSKPQYVPLAPLFGLFGVFLARYVRYPYRYSVSSLMVVILLCVAAWYYRQTPPVFSVGGPYVQIFMDMLPHSSTPRQDLEALGLNPKYEIYSGTNPYAGPLNDDPEFRAEFLARISVRTVPLFYLAHPRRFYELCARCAKHMFWNRVYLGYYEASSGKPPGSKPPAVWSSVRERVFPKSLFFLLVFLFTGVAAVVLFIRSSSATRRGLYVLYLLLVFIAATQFLTAILPGGGEPDLEKHLFMFNLAFDFSLVLIVTWSVNLAQNFRRPFTAPPAV